MEDYTHLNLKRDLNIITDDAQYHEDDRTDIQHTFSDLVKLELRKEVDSELNNFHQTLIDIGWLLSILPKWHTVLNSSLLLPVDIRNILTITGDIDDKDFEDILAITRIILRDKEKYNDYVFDEIKSINTDIYEDMMRGLINERYIMDYCRRLYSHYLNTKPQCNVSIDIQNRDIPEFDGFEEFIDIQ